MQFAGFVIALVAALAALGATYFSWRAIEASNYASRQAEREALRRRIVEFGALAEQIFWTYVTDDALRIAGGSRWHTFRNRAAQLLVGLEDELPLAKDLPLAISGPAAANSAYRADVNDALERLAQAAANDGVRTWPWSRRTGD